MMVRFGTGSSHSPGVVDDVFHTNKTIPQRLLVVKVAYNPLDIEAVEARAVRLGSDQSANMVAILEQ
jgi:hypothetical protein